MKLNRLFEEVLREASDGAQRFYKQCRNCRYEKLSTNEKEGRSWKRNTPCFDCSFNSEWKPANEEVLQQYKSSMDAIIVDSSELHLTAKEKMERRMYTYYFDNPNHKKTEAFKTFNEAKRSLKEKARECGYSSITFVSSEEEGFWDSRS